MPSPNQSRNRTECTKRQQWRNRWVVSAKNEQHDQGDNGHEIRTREPTDLRSPIQTPSIYEAKSRKQAK